MFALRFKLADCHEVVGNSLFLMGEIGGNDFNYPFFLQRSVAEVKTYVPYVIRAITSAVNVRFYFSLSKSLICSSNFAYVITLVLWKFFYQIGHTLVLQRFYYQISILKILLSPLQYSILGILWINAMVDSIFCGIIWWQFFWDESSDKYKILRSIWWLKFFR